MLGFSFVGIAFWKGHYGIGTRCVVCYSWLGQVLGFFGRKGLDIQYRKIKAYIVPSDLVNEGSWISSFIPSIVNISQDVDGCYFVT